MIEFMLLLKYLQNFKNIKCVYVMMLSVKEGYKLTYTACFQLCKNLYRRKGQIVLKS